MVGLCHSCACGVFRSKLFLFSSSEVVHLCYIAASGFHLFKKKVSMEFVLDLASSI